MKKIGGCIYMHYSKYDTVCEKITDMIDESMSIMFDKGMLLEWLGGEVYKIDMKNNVVTIVESPNWDDAREPIVGDSYRVDINKKEIKTIKSKGQIYHHKWMFVDDDYDGFDIEESKRWSEKWQSVLPKTREVKSRIGYKKYWDEYLKEHGLEVE